VLCTCVFKCLSAMNQVKVGLYTHNAQILVFSLEITEERLNIVLKRYDVPKRMASDLVGSSAMLFSQNQTRMALKHDWSVSISFIAII